MVLEAVQRIDACLIYCAVSLDYFPAQKSISGRLQDGEASKPAGITGGL
jgi:hypothetical protein